MVDHTFHLGVMMIMLNQKASSSTVHWRINNDTPGISLMLTFQDIKVIATVAKKRDGKMYLW